MSVGLNRKLKINFHSLVNETFFLKTVSMPLVYIVTSYLYLLLVHVLVYLWLDLLFSTVQSIFTQSQCATESFFCTISSSVNISVPYISLVFIK